MSVKILLTSLAVLSLSAVGGTFQEANAELDPKYKEGLSRCYVSDDDFVPHKKGYEAGKTAAIAINLWYFYGIDMKPNTGDETPKHLATLRDIFLKTRASFASIAPLALTKMGKHEVAGCIDAQLGPLQDDAWSSVHSGLTDHLEPELKKHFFEIPER